MSSDWIELWLDRGGGAPEALRIGYSPGTTSAEVSRALADHVASCGRNNPAAGARPPVPDPIGTTTSDPGGTSTPHPSLVGVDPPTGVICPDGPLERSGLRRGQVVRLADEPTSTTPRGSGGTPAATSTTVLVRRGPDRGRRSPLSESMVVGRASDCDLSLADPAVSRRHVRLTRRGTLVEVEPLGSAPVGIDGRRLGASEPVEPGTPIRLGDSELIVLAPTRPASANASTRSHQRPPRAPWAPDPPVLDIAEPPRRTGVGTVPWLSIGLTAAFAVVMVMGGGFGGGVTGNLIWFFTPLLLASGAVEYALSARREDRRAREHWRAELADRCSELGDRLDAEALREAHVAPPPSEWALTAQVGSARLWERRREHGDALRLRLGLTHARATVDGELPPTGPTDLLTEAYDAVDRIRWRQDVVSTLDLTEVGSAGVHGVDAHHLAASLVAQLVAAVGPEDVALTVAVQERRARHWHWVSALPHVRSAAELLDGQATAGVDGHDRLVATLSALGAARRRRAAADGRQPSGEVPVVAVIDGELGTHLELRRLAALCRLADVGIHVLWLERQPSRTPLGCGATITTARKGLATVVPRPGVEPHQVRWEALSAERLERLARHLAPRRDGDRASTGGGLPAAVSLAALPVPTGAIGTLAAAVGIGPDGPVTIDLRRDGPHVLVAGTTGAGKSELLRTLVAALAMAHSPQRLNFVLVDFKGGTGMGPLARLPHVAGMITDLDLGEAQRLRLGLEAEVERRLRLLQRAGVENLAALELQQSRTTDGSAPPAIVLVIDEFAALARQAPETLDGLVDLAQRGRSLGIHLVLATQRPRGVISDNIRANTNLRLVARMADAEESIDVLDDPAAAQLAVGVPGRVLMRVGATAPMPLQVAFTGTPVGRRPPVIVAPLTLDLPPTEAASLNPSPGQTEAEAVVAATRTAAGENGAAQRLWLEGLPRLLDQHALTAGGTTRGWPLALADLPRRRRRDTWAVASTGGVLLILGGGGSGRTSALRALAVTAAADGAAVVGLDGAGGPLARLDAATIKPEPDEATATGRSGPPMSQPAPAEPGAVGLRADELGAVGLGAVVPVRDDERLARLLWWLEQDRPPAPRVLVVDGWEGVWDRADQAGGSSWLARLVELIRTARSRGLTVAVSASRAGALPPEVRSARTELLALPGAEVDPDLGLARPPELDQPPGRGRLVTVQPHLLAGESAPAEGPVVQLRWVPPEAVATRSPTDARHSGITPAPLLVPHPPRIRLAQEANDATGIGLGLDLERDLPVAAPGQGPFWVLGRPRSGRSTTLAALAAGLRPVAGRSVLFSHGGGARQAGVWDDVFNLADRVDAPLGWPFGSGPAGCALVGLDDAHRLDDDGWAALHRWVESLIEGGHQPLLALAADPAALDRWNPVVTSLLGHGTGLMLAPEPDEDGRLLGGDLPRFRPFSMSAGRGYLIARGETARPVQVCWPHG